MTAEEFDDRLKEMLDTIVAAMAENSEIVPEKFYGMVCILENLSFFSPVIYGALRKTKE